MRLSLAILLTAFLCVGCGEQQHKTLTYAVAKGGNAESAPADMFREAGAAMSPTDKAAAGANSPQGRKIIHNIDFDVVVNVFTDVPSKVDKLVAEFTGAYVANMSLSGNEGQSRAGRWEIRVPNSGQASLLARIRELGTVAAENRKSDDVSEEFYDLEARLKNKRETEARLLKVQQERTGDLKDILEVEQQIDRVRGEIEQMQGRLERLSTLTSLSTVMLSVREIRNYQPAQAVSLMDRVAGTFDSSLSALRGFGERALLFVTALAPWLPVLVVAALFGRLAIRRFRIRLASESNSSDASPPTSAPAAS